MRVPSLLIEADRIVTTVDGQRLGKRIDDIVLDDVDGTFIDAKAWAPEAIRQRIKASMSFKPAGALDDKLGDAGQLYLDMIDFYKNRGKGVEWHFDPRAKGMEGDIKKWMSEGIDDNREYFIKHLGLSNANGAEIRKAFSDMKDNLSEFIVIQEY